LSWDRNKISKIFVRLENRTWKIPIFSNCKYALLTGLEVMYKEVMRNSGFHSFSEGSDMGRKEFPENVAGYLKG
jgi:hypothetical protein